MATAISLECEERKVSTKGYLKQLRKKGLVPGVVYGKDWENLPLVFDGRELSRVFQKGVPLLFSLQLKGQDGPIMALLKEIQRTPTTGEIVHVDFQRVKVGEKITAEVPVVVVGEEAVEERGGIVQLGVKELTVECLLKDLPSQIVADISLLGIGDKFTVGDLPQMAGVRILDEEDTVLALIVAPAKETVATEATGGEEEK